MTPADQIIDSLNAALKYERTLHQCYGQHHAYFCRWRIHRLEAWMAWQQGAACKRVCALELRINVLDTIPGNELWEIEVQPVTMASEITGFMDYFVRLLTEARQTYQEGIDSCSAMGDSVSGGLLGAHKCEIEDQLQRFEAKLRKVALVGPEMYIAEHFHKGE